MPSTVVLGIDFGGTKVALAVGDLAGDRLGTAVIPAAAESGAAASLAGAIEAARRLLDRVAPGRELAGVGVSTFGIPGPDGVALAPAIDGWADLALHRELGAAFSGVPIRLVTDVKAAAQVEAARGALVGCDPAVYLNLGTGLAAAIIAGGTVIAGRHGASGEIGYNLRGVGDRGGYAAGSASLEEAVAGRGLGERASALLGRPSSAAELFTLARHDAAAQGLVAEALDELAVHVANLAIAIDPARIAVGGGLTASADVLLPALRRRLAQAVPFPPELVTARFDQDGALRGAIALALDHALA